ncbi:signal recognition particle-docking protein FtsY [Mobiluncus curtisii]|uniref:Signal recognition particle receptor FtsY n=1 Tax=Mobiluncus curtisii ATCC 51333 TaxID=887326 RepID=E6M0D7_9ACTO|nr:signal recognition particle-docking protein FtsY [Mobiluncus curtisii]EFU79417.1 signal recognition particle-docking protein FtsY [Mobiluncus curtisii ATCC 51333]
MESMNILSTTLNNSQGLEGYTDPLIFMIPLAIAFIVIVIVASASQIDSKQRKIRSEDRLLDTLERIREDSSEDGESTAEAPPLRLRQGEKELRNIIEKTIHATGSDEDEHSDEDAEVPEVSPDALQLASDDLDDEDDLAETEDWGEEDESFDEEEAVVKPDGVYCDPDGLCFRPLPGQSVEEARAAARAAMEAAAAALTADTAEDAGVAETETAAEPAEAVSVEPESSEVPEESATPEATDSFETVETPEESTEPESAVQVEPSAADNSEPREPEAELEVEEIEKPESKTSRLRRLKERLAGKGKFGRAILNVLSNADLEDSDWEAIEDELLAADLGVEPTVELIGKLKVKQKVAGEKDATQVRRMAKRMLTDMLDRKAERRLNLEVPEDSPTQTAGVLLVGVNGGGKTTTVGKLARLLVAERKTVVLGAADTFRAAAGEQLQTWGDRVGVPVVRAEKDQADPASVAFDAAKAAREAGSDVVVIDTAGRLQNKVGLMDELGKIKRVAEKQVPITEVLLVIDATTGQNALSQAKIFTEAVGVTGIVLTKLDGSAKGGVIVPLQRELGIPVKLVGLGEGPDDLAPFVPGDFADALLDA